MGWRQSLADVINSNAFLCAVVIVSFATCCYALYAVAMLVREVRRNKK